MTDYNEADKDKKIPDEVPTPEGEENPQLPVEDSQDMEEQQGTEAAGNDPLMELRQSLVSEEPEPEPKPDFLHRMTGTLGSKKTSGKPKESGFSGTGFGVRTTGTTPEGPDTSSMQVFRNTPQAGSEPGQPKGEEEEAEPDEPASRVRPFEPENYSSARRRGLNEDLDEDKSSGEAPGSMYPFTGRGQGARTQRWNSDLEDEEPSEEPEDKPEEKPEAEPQQKLPSGEYTRQQLNRYIAYNPKQTLWTRFRNASAVDKGLIIALLLAVLAVGGLLFTLGREALAASRIPPTATAASTTEALGIPFPLGVDLPGGWHFLLSTGNSVNGKWEPKTSEWLEGTEIRRVIAIPWNKQVEAVARTFVEGDTIDLEMSNGDRLSYKVQTVSEVAASDTTILYDTHPSLAIILMNPESDQRLVIIAVP